MQVPLPWPEPTDPDAPEDLERYRNLFENIAIGIYRTTPDGRFLEANPAILRMLGYDSLEELKSCNLQRISAFERHRFKEAVESAGEVHGRESVWLRRDGTPITAHWRGN